MKDTLQARCTRFVEARDIIKDTFRWESSYLPPVCANLFCAKDMLPEEEKLRACRELINRNTGIFSSFRGNIRIPLACMLSMEADPEEKFQQAQELYQALKQHFYGSDYLALAAFLLTDYDCTDERLSRGRRLYKMMKEEHPFLTSSEDSIFAVLMAWSTQSDETLIQDMEACYRILKERFHDSDCVQTMTHILAMEEGDATAKCERVFTLYDAIERNGGKYGKHYELATLAALAMLKTDPEELARGMMEADSFLAEQKGYGFWGVGKKQRLMHAAMIVSDEYVPHDTVDQAALTGTISLIIAQQIAMCAAVAASAASH
ncbi:MAG: DUF4003 family protein [Clostridia bacterium]|nr:DUF4003 family protein [Clostridia bacterium]MBQ6720808.1 DUF4003 family protein [Clostridia bacterium]